ncbi:MAG: hypothetical protein AAGG75_14530 [Bacteroidota bacterium]
MELYAGSNSFVYVFFSNLRRAGFPLGIDDYQLLLKALRLGFPLENKANLLQLCKRLWLKSLVDEADFDHHFRVVFAPLPDDLLIKLQEAADTSPASTPRTEGDEESEESRTPESSPPEPEATPREEKDGLDDPQAEKDAPPFSQEPFGESLYDEVASMRIATSDFQRKAGQIEAAAQRQFGLRRDYLPVTQRSLLSMWRYLRLPEGISARQEIDIDATIRHVYRSGFFLSPIYRKTRPKHRLSILIDQGGSMVAFQALASRIAETARRANARRNVEQYFFHNVPAGKYLFKDARGLQRHPISALLSHSAGHDDALLIISDAGAARGNADSDRIDASIDFLTKISKSFERIVWINPMPRRRWRRTSASVLSRYVDMFAADEAEVKKAIKKLQGQL